MIVSRENGMIQRIHTDSQTGRTILETAPDNRILNQMFEEVKAVRNQVDENARWGEGDLVASIPPALQWQLMRQAIWPGPANDFDPKPLKRWLNDPDNRGWRLRTDKI